MSTLNLYAADPSGHAPRPDERFHLQPVCPTVKSIERSWFGKYRTVIWDNLFLEDGSPAKWSSTTIRLGPTDADGHFRAIQWYSGTAKCDPTRTYMLRHGQLGGTADEQVQWVMTTTPKEMLAFRLRTVDETPVWTNMGGI